MPGQYQHRRAKAQMACAGAEPGQQVEARRDLAKAGEMMLDQKGAVIAERLGFDIVLDEIAEALAAVGVGAAAPGLGTAKKSKSHWFDLLSPGSGTGLRPELPRGEARTFRQTGELRPYDARIDGGLAHPGAVAAIAPGNDVLAADQLGITADALGDQLGVLDKIGLRLDRAGDQHLALRQFYVFEDRPFMRMARVGGFEGKAARFGHKDGLDDLSERHVAMVRAFVIAPAEVQAQPLRGDVT